jgi:hypothetical protein
MSRETRPSQRALNPTTPNRNHARIRRIAVTTAWTDFNIPNNVNYGYFCNDTADIIKLALGPVVARHINLAPGKETQKIPLRGGGIIKIRATVDTELVLIVWNE